jgi:hypothetical protein
MPCFAPLPTSWACHDATCAFHPVRMKCLAVAVAVLLTSCSPVRHRFEVDAAGADAPVSAAVVSLCGEAEVALERSGRLLVGTVASRCEGSGYLRLAFADGTGAECPLGYVTTLEDHWAFDVRGRSCTLSPRQSGTG